MSPDVKNNANIELKRNNAGLEKPTSGVVPLKWNSRQQRKGFLELACGWIIEHQIGKLI